MKKERAYKTWTMEILVTSASVKVDVPIYVHNSFCTKFEIILKVYSNPEDLRVKLRT